MTRSKYEQRAAELVTQAWCKPMVDIHITGDYRMKYRPAWDDWRIQEGDNEDCPAPMSWRLAVDIIATILAAADQYPPDDVVQAAQRYVALFPANATGRMCAEWILARHEAEESQR